MQNCKFLFYNCQALHSVFPKNVLHGIHKDTNDFLDLLVSHVICRSQYAVFPLRPLNIGTPTHPDNDQILGHSLRLNESSELLAFEVVSSSFRTRKIELDSPE